MLLAVVVAGVLILAGLRYYLVFRKFRIFEHLMMAGGMGVAGVGIMVIGGGVVGFLVGAALMAWGIGMWLDGEIQILGNLKWRRIRAGVQRSDLLLLKFREDDRA